MTHRVRTFCNDESGIEPNPAEWSGELSASKDRNSLLRGRCRSKFGSIFVRRFGRPFLKLDPGNIMSASLQRLKDSLLGGGGNGR